MEIERIEDWRGQQVVDRDGEKIGKLEDVYRPVGGGDPAFASIKTGLMGRKLTLVPLQGASATRDHISLAVDKAQVDDAPHAAGEDELTAADEDTLLAHYGLPDQGEQGGDPNASRYESTAITEARAAEADSKLKEAERLEAEAATEDDRANEARRTAAAGAETEREATGRSEENLQEAARLRREAGEPPPG